jgi:hypothetical protein
MRLLTVGKAPGGGDDDKATGQRVSRIVSYPPPSTGTNYNLIDKVEPDPSDRVVWHIIYSPDGRFTYDYSIKSARRRRTRCPEPGCENFLERAQRKCIKCQLKTRKDRNRRHYQVLKTRFKAGSP